MDGGRRRDPASVVKRVLSRVRLRRPKWKVGCSAEDGGGVAMDSLSCTTVHYTNNVDYCEL